MRFGWVLGVVLLFAFAAGCSTDARGEQDRPERTGPPPTRPSLLARIRDPRDAVAWAEFVDVYSRHGTILRTWTETEVAGDGVGRLGADLIGGLSGAVADKVALPRAAKLDPAVATLAIVVMIERLTYLHSSGQVAAGSDELLDVLTDTIEAILFGTVDRPTPSAAKP